MGRLTLVWLLGTGAARVVAGDVGALATEELLARAQAANQEMDFDVLIPLAEEIIARKGTPPETAAEAYLLLGSALAIVKDSSEAEQPFRMLLRLRPDFDLPSSTPPKILAVFRLVQAEERQIATRMRALERKRIISELELTGEPRGSLEGGKPLAFSLRLRDPRAVVDGIRVLYRREDARAFSALALDRNPEGLWVGNLPGAWTTSEDGFVMYYYVSTQDRGGEELLTLGAAAEPRSLQIQPGVIDDRAIYERWWFWVALGAVVVVGATGGYVAYRQSTDLPGSDYAVSLR